MKDKECCFVITPIGDDTDPIRRHIDGIIEASIRPALEDKYEIKVAHKICEPGSITKQVITEIYSAKLAIANLTNRNPNVMYELAFRHSLGKPVIMIAEKGTPLPSDIIMERTIFYQNDAQGVLELRENIREAESKIDFEKESSPIYDIIHEYDRDVQIIKISEGKFPEATDEDNGNILKYILQKLNNLEDAMQSLRPVQSMNEGADFSRICTVVFEYETLPKRFKEQELLYKLQKILLLEPSIRIEGVKVDDQKKRVCIYFILNGRVHEPQVYNFFMEVLNEYGFTKLRLFSRSSQK